MIAGEPTFRAGAFVFVFDFDFDFDFDFEKPPIPFKAQTDGFHACFGFHANVDEKTSNGQKIARMAPILIIFG